MDVPPSPAPARFHFPPWLRALALVAAATAAYWNSLAVPFFFDDIPAIVENDSIRSLWHPAELPRVGSGVAGRPVVNWSFALNYALGGLDPRGYHLTNLLVHAAAALLLWGVLRRTFARAGLPAGVRGRAETLAWASALVWELHPLLTESVTCTVQRTESLAGMIFLTALYAFVRAVEPEGRTPFNWLLVSVNAAWLGMATKETMVALPLVLWLYDRTFVAGTFREAWRRRRWYHAGLMLAWVLLAYLMTGTEGRGGTAVLGREVTAWGSLLSQSRAITGYLALAVWPHPLVLDYGNFVTDAVTELRAVVPQFLFVGGLVLATLLALRHRPWLGFAGAWFFLNLAPSSSVVPLLTQIRAEHRMYLPLAAVLVPGVVLLWRIAGRAAPWLLAGWALALGAGTVARNHDYRTVESIWRDTVRKRPENPRAHYALGRALERAGDQVAAEQSYRAALQLRPAYPEANLALAALLLQAGRKEDAQAPLAQVMAESLNTANACNNLGLALLQAGHPDRARAAFEQALRIDPASYDALNNLGFLLASQGRPQEAVGYLRASASLRPEGRANENLVAALLQTGQMDQAIAAVGEVLRAKPDDPAVHFRMGQALLAAERLADAADQFTVVVRAVPTHREAWVQLGLVQHRLGREAAAREAWQRVLALDPGNPEATRQLKELEP